MDIISTIAPFAFTLCGAVVLGICSAYQIKLHRRNIDIESKRHYYPLEFEKSSKFHVKRVNNDLFQIKQTKGRPVQEQLSLNVACGANLLHDAIFQESDLHEHLNGVNDLSPNNAGPSTSVIDGSDETVEYRLQRRIQNRPGFWWSQEWYFLKKNEPKAGNYISSIHVKTSRLNFWGKNTVYFPLRNRFNNLIGSSLPTGSIALSPSRGTAIADEDIELASPNNFDHNAIGSPFTNINTSTVRSYSIGASTPYIDPSLKTNYYVSKNELGETETILDDIELFAFEERKLFKINCHIERSSKTTSFKISKNSMEYKWRSNGYLEKNSRDKIYAATERIGFAHVDIDKRTFTIYLNENRIDKFSALLTFFIQFLSVSE